MEYRIIPATIKETIKIKDKEYRIQAWIDIPEEHVTMPMVLWNNFLRTPQSIEMEEKNKKDQ